MKILVAAKKLEVTEGMRQFIHEQVEKISKLHKKVSQVRVFLEKIPKKNNDPHANQVTFEIQIPGKNVIVSKRATDMYLAIVQTAQAGTRQLRKQYERRMTLKRQRLATPV